MDTTPVTLALDAYAPDEIARRVEETGVAKARRPWPANAMLGVLGGAFIALGCLWFTLVASDAALSFAATRVLGGFVFSLGLVLVVVAGAELFTGNNLLSVGTSTQPASRGSRTSTGLRVSKTWCRSRSGTSWEAAASWHSSTS